MFNRTYNTEYNHNYPDTIEIKNAPTSDQLRLLRETEDALRKEILGAVRIDDNKFNASIFLRRPTGDAFLDGQELIVRVTLNGEELTVSHSICKWSYETTQDVLQIVLKKLADKMAEHCLRQAIVENKQIIKLIQTHQNHK